MFGKISPHGPATRGPGLGWLRLPLVVLLIVLLTVGTTAGLTQRSYAQSAPPQSDDFNSPTFSAPFHVVCAAGASHPCPDAQGSGTWSLDQNSSGQLRIWTQPGSLAGHDQSQGSARDLVLQPFDPGSNWTATTRMTFPATSNLGTPSGQQAGLIVYQDDQNYIFVGRSLDSSTSSTIRFVQDSGGHISIGQYAEAPGAPVTILLSLAKSGGLYQASFSYDGTHFTALSPASPAPSTQGYLASYNSPSVGLFAVGGNTPPNSVLLAADFDWFHVETPAPTSTPTPLPTATSTPQPTVTPGPSQVSTSATTVEPGTNVTIGGSGYAPGETVDITASFPLYNGNTLTVSRTGVAGSAGNLNPVTLTVPEGAKAGPVRISATGASSHHSGSVTLTVVYHPTITATAAVAPGGTITVTGHGFVARSSVKVAITTTTTSGASATRSVSVTTDSTGRFQTSINVSTSSRPGTYTLTATDTVGDFHASSKVAVVLNPTVTLSRTSVLPSHDVTVTGAGFRARVPVSVSATFRLYGGGSKTVSATATTSGTGTFSIKLTVPARAAAGSVAVTARTSARVLQKSLTVKPLAPSISVSPTVLLPGTSTVVRGAGYLPGSTVAISIPVTLENGSSTTLTANAKVDAQGAFTVKISVPADVRGGTYTVAAQGSASGRTAQAHLAVTKLAPSIVLTPSALAPGTTMTVTGFGFAAESTITLSINGQSLGTATTDATGHFSVKVTVPTNLPSGSTTLTAVSNSGVRATSSLTVNRNVAQHFYFASIYTGHQEYLDLLNPTSIRARVTVTYQLTTGATRTKTVTIQPHSRYTENVNADLGKNISTAASVSADVPIVASRLAYRGSEGTVVPGRASPATAWYFADGNTSHGYVEYIAVQNPGTHPAHVALHVMPTHHRAFTEYRTVNPTSRLTIKINKFVHDAVGVVVTSNSAVVANRTMRIHHGMTSKIGTSAPKTAWYIAGGPTSATAHNWIAVTNPSSRQVYLTLQAYNSAGTIVGTVKQWLKPNAREGYLMNKLAGTPAVAVIARASGPIVVEQTTYGDRNHDNYTATFGATPPATAWAFASVNTSVSQGQGDILSLFNPNQAALPMVVQFMDTTGHVTSRTYVVGPMAHLRINVTSVVPGTQLGLVVTSNQPFVALNRYTFNRGFGAATSIGIPYSST